MTRTDEGEFELVLGNRQLISIFFLVVVLLGVFFSMGYFVGRSSTPIPAEAARSTVTAAKPLVVEPPARTETGQPNDNAAASPEAAPANDQKRSPAAGPEVSRPAEPVQRTAAATPKPALATPPPATTAHEERPETGRALSGEPGTGETFLQVVATTRPDAELVAEILAKKGFKSMVAPGPSPALFRVLVGPVKDAAGMAQTRTSLESAGFKNPIVRKY